MGIFFYYWNLNSTSTHDFSKASLLKTLIICKQYDIICLTETFLDFLIERTDNRLNTEEYNLIRVDFLGNKKKEGSVCTIQIICRLQKEMIYLYYRNV